MNKNVLVIDQDPISRNRIANLLSLREYQPHQAATHEEAFELLEKHEYALIFIELRFTEENGFTVLDHIRSHFPKKVKHTILMTSGDPSFLASVPADQYCELLVKPFSVAEFYQIVDLCEGGKHIAGNFQN